MGGPAESVIDECASLLRAAREACGLSQDRWAAFVGVSRKTAQRWEAGEAVPDATAEASLLELCREWHAFESTTAQESGLTADRVQRVVAGARLHRRAARAPATVVVDHPDEDPPLATDGDLVGRTQLLARLREATSVSRIVTLTGPGGVGKTALASAFMRTLDDDVRTAFVSLAGVRDAVLVPTVIAGAVGARQARGVSVRDATVAALSGSPTVLVVDNFEHVLWAAPFVGDLVASCPHLRIVVTSRRALGLPGEHEVVVPVLSSAAAVTLFTQRAGDALVDGELAREICERVDHLPLAIELLAARARVTGAFGVLGELDRRLTAIAGGGEELPTRHRALQTTLDWSHELLTRDEQTAFRRCAVFASSFPPAAAAHVIGELPDGGSPEELIDALADHSLLTRQDDGWYASLETVREYGARHLEGQGEERETTGRHVEWYFALAERETAQLAAGARQREALDVLNRHAADLRLAFRHATDGAASADDTLRFVGALSPWWDVNGAFSEARDALRRALDCDGGSTVRRAIATTWAAYFARLQGDPDDAEGNALDAIRLWDEGPFPSRGGYAELILGQVALERGAQADAVAHLERSVELFREVGDTWGLVRPVSSLGAAARAAGDLDAAIAHHQAALDLSREIGDRFIETYIAAGLAHTLTAAGRHDEAIAVARTGVRAALDAANPLHVATNLEALAIGRIRTSDHASGVELAAAAADRRAATGAPAEQRDRAALDDALTTARRALGSERFAEHWNRGRALTDEHLRLALGDG